MGEIAGSIREWLENYNSLMATWRAKGGVQTPANARDGLARLTRTLVTEVPTLACIKDGAVEAPGNLVPVRVYHPEPDTALPVLVYLHGGGHVAGSVDVFDPLCRKIAIATRRLVIAVDYRLAPEHPYPAGLQDASAVIAGYPELLERLGLPYKPGLALCGDSAGGAMAATLVHAQQNSDSMAISHLLLLYPSLDYTLSLPSVQTLAKGYFLETEGIYGFLHQYFKNHEDLVAASPLFMEIPAGFPPTFIVSAGFCPLRDEAIRYAEVLRQCGVYVCHLHLNDMIHAFLNMENLAPERCHEVYRAMSDFLAG